MSRRRISAYYQHHAVETDNSACSAVARTFIELLLEKIVHIVILVRQVSLLPVGLGQMTAVGKSGDSYEAGVREVASIDGL